MIDRACISLNDNCNLNCKYCHFQDKMTNKENFNIEELINIIDNIHRYCKANNIDSFKLGIVGSGEPLLMADEIMVLLEYIRSNNLKELQLYTITNAILLNENLIKQLYLYKDIITVSVSLDGYKKIHNAGRSLFETVMEKINLYKSIFKETPTINTTVNKLSYENKEKLLRFFEENQLINVNFSKIVGYSGDDLFISDRQYDEFINYVKSTKIKTRQFTEEKKYDCTMYGNYCGVGRTNIFITREGIYPCGRFYLNEDFLLGNYFDDLFNIEIKMSKLDFVEEGKCYYEEYVEDII